MPPLDVLRARFKAAPTKNSNTYRMFIGLPENGQAPVELASASRRHRGGDLGRHVSGRRADAIRVAHVPGHYGKAALGTPPYANAVEAMMKFNESLQRAGVLLALDGLHPPTAHSPKPKKYSAVTGSFR